MSKAHIILDRDSDRLVNYQSFARVTVGRQQGIRNIRGGEAVTLYLEFLAGNQLYYPIGRIFIDPKEAHSLAVALETMAKAINVGHE